ncbi:APC family permease [Corynebacterium poyangense]|uniref:APC family permease n=1 Tax=Corynebacterium poyangense TaxID=2684405 RepID=UPI001CCBC823|nr:APC family permease [Corynebacterium poyangense]
MDNTSLHRGLGTNSIVFMVLAAAAPITVVAANFPIIFMESHSAGAPLMILCAALILLLFSVGFVKMVPLVPEAGAFYSYVEKGLGTRLGMGTAGIALFSYILLTVSMTCYLGVQSSNLILTTTGLPLPWWSLSLFMIVIVGLLGYRDIELSAKVLGAVLVLEVLAVLILDSGILFTAPHLSLRPFSPTEALSGAPGLGLLFAFLGFFGFEATAVFRHEAKDPERVIPRATFLAVIFIGVFYTISAWLVANGIGVNQVAMDSTKDPENIIMDLASGVVTPLLGDIMRILVVTSMFACMLSFHNICSRYLFSLAQRRVLWAQLGVVHPRHHAPSNASLGSSFLCLLIVLGSAVAGLDPVTEIYTWYSGAGALGVIVMMVLCCAAVLWFFARQHQQSRSWLVFPSLGGVGLLGVFAVSLAYLPMMTGGITPAVCTVSALTICFLLGGLVSFQHKPAGKR